MTQTSHSDACQLRWALTAWVLTIAICSLYDLALLGSLPPLNDLIALHFAIALVAFGASFLAVWVLVRLPYLVLVVPAAAIAGFALAGALGAITYGSSGEELNGLMFRAIGGAIIGLVSGIAAWSWRRWAHRPCMGTSSASSGV